MGWYTFTDVGSGAAQADDANTMLVSETGSDAFVTLPYNITLQDVVLTTAPANNHQYAFWVGGKKVSANLFAAQLDPSKQTRFNIAAQNITIRGGSKIQIRTAQKAGAVEALSLSVIFTP
jgi:hypothetical protein